MNVTHRATGHVYRLSESDGGFHLAQHINGAIVAHAWARCFATLLRFLD